ncbi:MAG: lasso peptide biosynthesis B2 protein [Cyanobacteria bacterium J06560_5]
MADLHKLLRLHKFMRLSTQERRLLLEAYSLLNAIRLGLWLLPFVGLCNYLDKIYTSPSADFQQLSISLITRTVNISSRYSPGYPKCLARALTTQVLMRRRGYSPELKIGVMRGITGQFEAHAWIEYGGSVVIGDLANLKSFTPLPALRRQR